MAGKKINDLTPLGRNLVSTDELELSLTGATGSRKITGAELTANLQPTLVSGTNIKTVNGSSIVGSGDLVILDNLKGVHATLPTISGVSVSSQVNGTASASSTPGRGLRVYPFIPNKSFVSASLSFNVITAEGQLARILIYSSLNGKPEQKLYESADLSTATTGFKTALVSFNFTAGETYWIGINLSNALFLSTTHHSIGTMLPIGNIGFTGLNQGLHYFLDIPYNAAPATFGAGILTGTIVTAVFINPA